MITMKLTNNPGYPTRNPNYLGTIHHQHCGVAASVNSDYNSTLEVRRYLCGLEPANYQVPAIRLAVKYDYIGCVNIDDVSDPDDPVIVWMYDSWNGINV